MSLWDAKGKTFLITGGASGMGASYLHLFMDQGAKGIAILDIAKEQGKALAVEYDKTHPGQVTFIRCDMSKEDEITQAFEEVLAKFKQIDVIINNAGIMVDSPAVWRTASTVNFQGLVSLTLKGLSHMDKSEGGAGGTIVNISSATALTKVGYLPIYSAAKSAVLHFTRCITFGSFFETTGVRMMVICFGPTDTPLLHDLGKRSYNPKLEHELSLFTPENGVYYQKVESAISAVDHMLKLGTSGSVWVSADDKPAKDITPVMNEAYGLLENEFSTINSINN